MPSSAIAKIKSAPRSIIALLFLAALGGGIIFAHHSVAQTTIRVGGSTYTLAVADTPALRTKGLGGRSSVAPRVGMLFSYSNQDIRCFWMRDMHFSLDMIWLNSEYQVIHLAQNVSPSSYPQTFCANRPAQYVIELQSGQVAQARIHVGQILNF